MLLRFRVGNAPRLEIQLGGAQPSPYCAPLCSGVLQGCVRRIGAKLKWGHLSMRPVTAPCEHSMLLPRLFRWWELLIWLLCNLKKARSPHMGLCHAVTENILIQIVWLKYWVT